MPTWHSPTHFRTGSDRDEQQLPARGADHPGTLGRETFLAARMGEGWSRRILGQPLGTLERCLQRQDALVLRGGQGPGLVEADLVRGTIEGEMKADRPFVSFSYLPSWEWH